jgi:hypothetical protein
MPAAGGKDVTIKLQIAILVVLALVLVSAAAVPEASAGARGPTSASTAYLPIASSAPPVLFADDFEAGLGQWTPFLNHKRLNPEQWYLDRGKGYGASNAYTHTCCRGGSHAEDALTMVLVPGSEAWTDYRLRARFLAEDGRLAGVWFRGTYRDVETSGQWLTGYLFTVDVRPAGTGRAKLWQHRTTEEHGDEDKEYYWYHYSNPLFLTDKVLNTPVNYGEWHEITVEVRGPHIKGWLDDELAINYVDKVGSIFLNGTIGLVTYGSEPKDAHIRFDDVLVEPLP